MMNKLQGQPDSYDKKSKYRFGKTLGAGTYGIVREADVGGDKVAVKIILKKSVKGNEQMVYDELQMLQTLKHPHIVQFVDWFESRVSHNLYTVAHTEINIDLGQILHCDTVGYWWRVVRPHLR
jgi:calcium/calmodulin-dependent protein kinase I